MAKGKSSQWVCGDCGNIEVRWFGKCPGCGKFGSLVEEAIAPTPSPSQIKTSAALDSGGQTRRKKSRKASKSTIAAQPLGDITEHKQVRFSSGFAELDRVLGGGIVPGALVLIGGNPGIGKSTLLLQTAQAIASRTPVLYVCAEESGQQIKLRAQRLGIGANSKQNGKAKSADQDLSQHLYILPETDLETILLELENLGPTVAIIDSIQALFFSSLTSAPGSVAQVRECTAALMRLAKREDITLLIVGHVTKEGAIAGPKVLEHLVDTVLYFEGDRFASFRLLRSVKNRFGATQELGVFEMVDRGLREVSNPSALFLGDREERVSGTANIVACEGTRPIVAELQALVSPSSYSSPRRVTTGVGYNRLLQILAVLEKRLGIPLSRLDAYVSTSGGLSVEEPAADLGVAVALVASFRDRLVDPGTVLIGEVGLGGQVRPVSQMEMRLKEAAKLGFRRAIVPKGQGEAIAGLEIIAVSRLIDAVATALGGTQDVADYPDD
ncbi:MAG: DNA repair protein RadA [Cyanophyceae cyanobacterium]